MSVVSGIGKTKKIVMVRDNSMKFSVSNVLLIKEKVFLMELTSITFICLKFLSQTKLQNKLA